MNYTRIIMGIDPGTNNLGIGVIGFKGQKAEILVMDTLKLDKISDHQAKLKRIFETVLRFIDQFHPEEFAIESPFFGKNVQSMLKLGRAQGVAMAAALYRNLPVFEYSPRKIKQAITGRGNASKEQVAAMLQHLAVVQNAPEYFDTTDAVAVAFCHYFQSPNVTLNKKQSYSGWEAFVSANTKRVVK